MLIYLPLAHSPEPGKPIRTSRTGRTTANALGGPMVAATRESRCSVRATGARGVHVGTGWQTTIDRVRAQSAKATPVQRGITAVVRFFAARALLHLRRRLSIPSSARSYQTTFYTHPTRQRPSMPPTPVGLGLRVVERLSPPPSVLDHTRLSTPLGRRGGRGREGSREKSRAMKTV